MAGIRRQARIAALQTLYELDSIARLRAGETLAKEALSFSEELVKGVFQNKSELDALIKKFAPAFPIEQMSIIDRNVLRLAIFEILFSDKIPFKVAINEAIELAKEFGSDSSPRLINGVLGSMTTERSSKQ